MKRDLLALPPQSRIRVRVPNGVFEVTLLAVHDASQIVEVLWGDGYVTPQFQFSLRVNVHTSS